jgi:hypothetical protein
MPRKRHLRKYESATHTTHQMVITSGLVYNPNICKHWRFPTQVKAFDSGFFLRMQYMWKSESGTYLSLKRICNKPGNSQHIILFASEELKKKVSSETRI